LLALIHPFFQDIMYNHSLFQDVELEIDVGMSPIAAESADISSDTGYGREICEIVILFKKQMK